MAETFVVTSTGLPSIRKDPDAVLDYTFNWADYLQPTADTIASVAWVTPTAPGSITVVSSSSTPTTATAFVSGGVLGQKEVLTCRITTTGGRVDDRSVLLRIVER
jgi:hypothetical protein